MRKLATITLAAMVALTGAASTASAALSSGDAPVIRQAKETQVAARGGGPPAVRWRRNIPIMRRKWKG